MMFVVCTGVLLDGLIVAHRVVLTGLLLATRADARSGWLVNHKTDMMSKQLASHVHYVSSNRSSLKYHPKGSNYFFSIYSKQ